MPVNLASRLEGQSKSYGVKTVIGPETNESVKDTYATLQLDMIAVKGKLKKKLLQLHLLGDSIFKQSSEFKNLESKHKKILENYFNQKWEECLKEIKTAKTLCNNLMSEYYDIMTLRINEFKENTPTQ